jgi:hypothetical protein
MRQNVIAGDQGALRGQVKREVTAAVTRGCDYLQFPVTGGKPVAVGKMTVGGKRQGRIFKGREGARNFLDRGFIEAVFQTEGFHAPDAAIIPGKCANRLRTDCAKPHRRPAALFD